MRGFLVLAAIVVAFSTNAQAFFPLKEGAVLEYHHTDANGKRLRDSWRNDRWTRITVDKIWGDSVANVTVWNETFERLKNNAEAMSVISELSYGDVVVRNNEVLFENVLWNFIPEDIYGLDPGDSYNNDGSTYSVEMTARAVVPSVLDIGDSLPESRYGVTMREQSSQKRISERNERNRELLDFLSEYNCDLELPETRVTEIRAMMNNLRVDGVEKVNTPAGEFECYKIGYEMIGPTTHYPGMPSGISIMNGQVDIEYDEFVPKMVRYVDYLSPEVGLVRREKMNGTGRKVEEVMELINCQ